MVGGGVGGGGEEKGRGGIEEKEKEEGEIGGSRISLLSFVYSESDLCHLHWLMCIF